MLLHFIELSGLFAAAFLSASLFPFQSELIFIGMLAADRYADWALLAVASAGNTLGSALNWWLGRYITHFEDRRWFPIKKAALLRAEQWFKRWGKWSLLLSWVPIIGDPLTMIAGVLRMRFLPFITIVAIAKTGRYLVIMAAM
jgi:membrane protein YqaA with SNARE-associated domain